MNKETEAMNVGEKLKIAHVLKSSIYSGAENVVLTIMKGLREEFEFLYIATEGPIREKLEEEQVHTSRISYTLTTFQRRCCARRFLGDSG